MFQNARFGQNQQKLTLHPSVRRGTKFLSQVFAHCEQLGQVVTTDQSPRQIAAAPDEAQALEQDAARRPAIERERALLGLEPRIETNSPAETPSLADQPEPESVFASQFASMAKIMEDILEGNKRNQGSQEQFPSHLDRVDTETAQPRQGSAVNEGQPGGPLGDGSSMGGRSDVKQPGLASSRWITPERRGLTELPSPPTAQRGNGMASGLKGLRQTEAAAQSPTMDQPGVPSRPIMSANTPSQSIARPVATPNGKARGREETGSLPAGQSWW